ncbi:MAG: hypothetical protein JO043_00085 [Candidatus Eremiobacteraeota bacterium]|nr:hypothetical protein [Candidatus Eremiobacteraeota bacterium]
MNLAKFATVGKSLVLEADYRSEHVDEDVLPQLLTFLVTIAEEQYPAIFRIISGDETLDALEASLKGTK